MINGKSGNERTFVIAVDGPAASGKGTIGKSLAKIYGLEFLDTGLLYREVAYRAIKLGLDIENERQLASIASGIRPGLIDNFAVRSSGVTKLAPIVAAMPQVRRALLKIQRKIAWAGNGAVLDGRDIGTVVCPDAHVKLFITASPEVRATRRLADMLMRGDQATFDGILADILARDERDRARSAAPLTPAADAAVIDTSRLGIAEAIAEAIRQVELSPSFQSMRSTQTE